MKPILTIMYIFVIGLAGIFASVSANAKVVRIDKISLDLPIPPGFCALDPNEPFDNRLINIFKAASKGRLLFLLAYADCDEHFSWLNGKIPLLNNYGYIATPISSFNMIYRGSRDDFVKAMIPRLNKGVNIGKIINGINTNIKETAPNLKIREVKNFGVIDFDQNAAYNGMVSSVNTELNTIKNSVLVGGFTVIKGKFIFIYRYGPVTDKDVFGKLLVYQREYLRNVISANKPK